MLPTQRGADVPVPDVLVVLALEAVDAELADALEDADEVDEAASVTTFVDEPQPETVTAAINAPRTRIARTPLLSP